MELVHDMELVHEPQEHEQQGQDDRELELGGMGQGDRELELDGRELELGGKEQELDGKEQENTVSGVEEQQAQ